MKTLVITRNKNFTRLIEATKNREHDLHGVPLTVILGMVVTKVDMYDQLKEIIDYVTQSLDVAISETLDNVSMDW